MQLLRRRLNSNKGDFGHIFIIAGSACYSGAASLCSLAAMRSGAGLVTLGIPGSLNTAMIKIKPKEVMTLPLAETNDGSLALKSYNKIKDFSKRADIVVIGPGLTQNKSTQALVRKLASTIDKPMVIDADGLNALAGYLDVLLTTNDPACRLPAGEAGTGRQRPTTVMTPHPGEMAKLLGVKVKEVQDKRNKIAREFSKRYRVILALKGHQTIVSDYSGRLYINKTGNPGMATAGSGDVLTGMIAAFLGQGLGGFEAVKYAVYLHGMAGDLAAEEKTQISLIASDIIDKIPSAIKKIQSLPA